jgi:hypothetical protein
MHLFTKQAILALSAQTFLHQLTVAEQEQVVELAILKAEDVGVTTIPGSYIDSQVAQVLARRAAAEGEGGH